MRGDAVTRRLRARSSRASSSAVFGRYELVSLLGEGGAAQVYEGLQRGPGGFERRVAVKILSDPGTASLAGEAALASHLVHPNLVTLFDYGRVDGREYIAMELVRGPTLAQALHNGGVPDASVVLAVAQALCRALTQLHRLEIDGRPAGLVHRDVKPSNVLVGPDGTVKLADLGIAKATFLAAEHTATNITKGTPAYMSPEQLRGSRLDASSDLFSLGALLAELVTGRPLFTGVTGPEVMIEIAAVGVALEDPEFPYGVDVRVPGLRAVLRRCLSPGPAARPRSAEELETALGALGPVAPPGRVAAWAGARNRPPRRGPVAPTVQDTSSLPPEAFTGLDLSVRSREHKPVQGRRWALLGGAAVAIWLAGLVVGLVVPDGPAPGPHAPHAPIVVHDQEEVVAAAGAVLDLTAISGEHVVDEVRLVARLPGADWAVYPMAPDGGGRWHGRLVTSPSAVGTAAYYFRFREGSRWSSLAGPDHPWRIRLGAAPAVPAVRPATPTTTHEGEN